MEKPKHSIVYVLPEPSTSILRGPILRRIPGAYGKAPSMSTVSYLAKQSGEPVIQELQFLEPVAKMIFSLFAVPEFALVAYDKVIELPDSDWLLEVRARIASRPSRMNPTDLRHFALMFDNGPFHDFVCRGFNQVRKNVAELPKSAKGAWPALFEYPGDPED